MCAECQRGRREKLSITQVAGFTFCDQRQKRRRTHAHSDLNTGHRPPKIVLRMERLRRPTPKAHSSHTHPTPQATATAQNKRGRNGSKRGRERYRGVRSRRRDARARRGERARGRQARAHTREKDGMLRKTTPAPAEPVAFELFANTSFTGGDSSRSTSPVGCAALSCLILG